MQESVRAVVKANQHRCVPRQGNVSIEGTVSLPQRPSPRVLDMLAYCFGQLPCSGHNIPWFAHVARTVACNLLPPYLSILGGLITRGIRDCLAVYRLRLFVTCTLIAMVPEAPLVQTERLMPVKKPASAAWTRDKAGPQSL